MSLPLHFLDIPIYRKALEIKRLTVDISQYITEDLCELTENGREDKDIYFSGDIVQQSFALAPEILNVEKNRNNYLKKDFHINTLHQLTKLLYKNCKRLENANTNGRDYLKLLRLELRNFNQLQEKWMLTL